MAADLTLEQRWLLLTMGGWQIVDALIGPGGVSHLMQSCWGSSRQSAIPGAPEWMSSFQTIGGKVFSPGRSNPKVTITAAQINAYAQSLPREIRDELEELAAERTRLTRANTHAMLAKALRLNDGEPAEQLELFEAV